MATITTRAGKGSPLTNDEVDANFTNLNTDKAELSGASFTGNVSFGDNDKAIFGGGNDLSIYHDGSHSYIEDAAGTGNLKVRTNTFQIENAAGTELSALFLQDGAVTLYNDNTARLATTSTGIDVTGTVTTNNLTLSNTFPVLKIEDSDGTNQNLEIVESSGASFITARNGSSYGTINLRRTNGTSTSRTMQVTTLGDFALYADDGTTQAFYWDASTSRLGLGTTNPQATLHTVAGSQYGEAARFANNGDAVSWARADWVNDQASGAGIIYRDQLGTFTFRNDNSSGTAMTMQILAGGTTDGNIVLKRNSGSASAVFQTTSTGDVVFYEDDGATQGMRWDASASSLGLGATNPTSTLDILAPTNYGLKVRDGTYTGIMVPSALGGIAAGTTSNHPFILLSNNTERMRVTSTGIDVTGSVTADGGTFEGELLVTGGGSGTILVNDEDSSLCPTMTFTRNGGGTTTNDFIKFKNSGGEVAAINSFGGAYFLTNVGIGTSAPIHKLSVDSSNRLWNVNDDGASNYVTTSATNTSGSVVFHRQVADRFHFGRAVDGTDDKVIIASNGTVAIGDTTTNNTANRLKVKGTQGDDRIAMSTASTTGNATIEAQVANYWSGATYKGTGIVQHDSASSGTTAGISNANLGMLRFQNGSAGLILTNGASPIHFATASTNRMTLDASGNLGIGEPLPTHKLEIAAGSLGTTAGNTVNIFNSSFLSSNVDNLEFTAQRISNGSDWQTAAHRIQRKVDVSLMGYMQFGNNDHDLITFGEGITEYMRIDGYGRVGIGLPNPQGYGKVAIQGGGIGDSNSNLALLTDGAAQGELAGLSLYGTFENTAGDNAPRRTADIAAGFEGGNWGTEYLAFHVGRGGSANDGRLLTTERVRLDGSGNLLVGTTNASGTAGSGIKLTNPTSPADDGKLMIVGATSTSGQDALQVYSTGASAYRFFVNYAGSVYATSTSITAISDQSLKENVRDLDKGLDTVLALQPRRFDWKNGDGNDIMGFVAQEVEEVMPELVHDYKYSETETKLGLKMGDMIPTLVKAIQDQQEIIDNLKSRIKQLEGAN